MKILLYTLAVCLGIACIYSCGSSEERNVSNQLEALDILFDVYPDSASQIIKKIPAPAQTMQKQYAMWCVLSTQADDRIQHKIKTDTLINKAAKYFEQHNDKRWNAKVHYLLGKYYQDNKKEVTNAAREYISAIPLAEKIKDWRLVFLANLQLGDLVEENELREEADSLIRVTLKAACAIPDMNAYSAQLMKATFNCIILKKYVSAAYYLRRAEGFAYLHKDAEYANKLRKLRAILYSCTGKYVQSTQLIKEGIPCERDSNLLGSDYLIIGENFFQEKRYDSATFYLKKALHYPAYTYKIGAATYLSIISKMNGQSEDVLRYDNLSYQYQDSLRARQQPIELTNALKQYLHNYSIKEYSEDLHISYYLTFTLSILSLYIIYLIFRRYKKKKDENKNLMILTQQTSEELVQAQRQLENEKNKPIELEKKLEQLTQLINDEDIPKNTKLPELIRNKAYKNKKGEELSDEEWNNIRIETERTLPGFVGQLQKHYEQLLDEDILFCCLVKLKFKYSEIADLYDCTLDAVYKRGKTVRKRMGITAKEDFDKTIKNTHLFISK